MLGRREHGHIGADFRNERNCGHWIGGEARNGTKQDQHLGMGLGKVGNLLFNSGAVRLKLVNVIQAFAELDGLSWRDGAVEGFAGVVQDVLGDRPGGLAGRRTSSGLRWETVRQFWARFFSPVRQLLSFTR